ncbi:MAG TPA: glycoside hydrolase family 16 protein [Streptosporangiaceae bacterium]|nr:glycoside hydrolase family 16 protein [Streptosporangiaceae bacterium]
MSTATRQRKPPPPSSAYTSTATRQRKPSRPRSRRRHMGMWVIATVVGLALAGSAWLAASHLTGETLSSAAKDHGAHSGQAGAEPLTGSAAAGSTRLHATVNAGLVSARLTPATGTAAVPLSASLTVHTTSGCVTVQVLSVGVRSANNTNLDFPGAEYGKRICTGQVTHVTGTETFPAGTYTMFGYYKLGGVYHNFTRQTLVISSPSPSPSPSPSSSPSRPPPAASAPTWNPGGTYTPTLDDEFNGSAINAALWETCFNCHPGVTGLSAPVNSLEQACYASANVSEPGDGFLHMDLARRPSTCGGSQPYTGSELDSKWAFSRAGGSFEARIFVPPASGQAAAWPAWWITNTTTGDEIDIVEGLAGRTAAHTHWYVGGQLQSHGCTSAAPAVGWHDFGVSVNTSAGTATFYYDGTQLCQLPYGGSSPLHLSFDNSIGAASVQPPSFPDGMLVDWVRAWSQP